MVIIILLAVLAVIGLIATFVEIRRDGFRPVPTDWTKVAERDALHAPESTVAYR